MIDFLAEDKGVVSPVAVETVSDEIDKQTDELQDEEPKEEPKK